MTNLSEEKRDKMIAFLKALSAKTDDDKDAAALREIERELNGKQYGLVWERHREEADERMVTSIPVFSEVPEKRIEADSGGPFHFILQGDNLHSLKLLEKTHRRKIDVIYIDPPYGTEGSDFIYDDRFVDKTDLFRHSKWISFMDVRLRIARELLSDTGVIFISIDDNEVYPLKLLCDDIFGDDAFAANMIWQKKTGASDAKGIATVTEYVLVYVRNPDSAEPVFDRNYEAADPSRYRHRDEYFERRGPFYYDSLDRGSVRYSDALNYPVTAPDGTAIYPNGRRTFEQDGWTWKWSREKLQWGLENGFIDIAPSEKKANGWAVRYKIYLNVDNEDKPIDKSAPYKNLITSVLNANAAADIKKLFDGRTVFQYSKPVELIKLLLSLVKKKDGIVLDFFAGSGTTGQAVLEQNLRDNSRRQFILCTNNQNQICERIAYERIRKRIEGCRFHGKKEDVLLKRTVVLEDVLGHSRVKQLVEKVEKEQAGNYEKIKRRIKGGVLQVVGINTYEDFLPGIPANVKYFVTDFIDRHPGGGPDSLRKGLLEHMRELVELESGAEVDGLRRVLIRNSREAERFISQPAEVIGQCEAVYLVPGVLPDDARERVLPGKTVVSIPEHYFKQELLEAEEASSKAAQGSDGQADSL